MNFSFTIYRLSQKLGLPEIYEELSEKSTLVPTRLGDKEAIELLTVGKTTDEAVAAYRYAKGYFHNLCDFAGWESDHKENEEFKYLEMGGKFRAAKDQKVIERLHDNEIKQAIETKV